MVTFTYREPLSFVGFGGLFFNIHRIVIMSFIISTALKKILLFFFLFQYLVESLSFVIT